MDHIKNSQDGLLEIETNLRQIWGHIGIIKMELGEAQARVPPDAVILTKTSDLPTVNFELFKYRFLTKVQELGDIAVDDKVVWIFETDKFWRIVKECLTP